MILARLKAQTSTLHERLEAALDLLNSELTVGDYRRLLKIFYGFYQPLETGLQSFAVGLESAGVGLAARRKLPSLHRDLLSLGLTDDDIRALPLCAYAPRVEGVAAAFGCLYVMEGATLGGQLLTRHFAAQFALTPENGCAFFGSYGPSVGARWREFGSALEEFARREGGEEMMVAAARATFTTLETWLTETRV